MAGRCWWKTTGDRLARCIGDGHKKAAMTCKRWGGLGAYHNERHNKLHDSSVLPSLIARENADAVSGQLGRRYRRGLSEWHPDFVLIGSDCIGSFCDLQPRHVHCTRAPFSLDTACGSGFSAGSKPRILCRCVMQTAPSLFAVASGNFRRRERKQPAGGLRLEHHGARFSSEGERERAIPQLLETASDGLG